MKEERRRGQTEKVTDSVAEVVRNQLADLLGATSKISKAEGGVGKESNDKIKERSDGKSEFSDCKGGERLVCEPKGWKEVEIENNLGKESYGKKKEGLV